jgi:hypothetical protein
MPRWLILAALLALAVSPVVAQNVTESKTFSNISATTAPFTLKGGNYQICSKRPDCRILSAIAPRDVLLKSDTECR